MPYLLRRMRQILGCYCVVLTMGKAWKSLLMRLKMNGFLHLIYRCKNKECADALHTLSAVIYLYPLVLPLTILYHHFRQKPCSHLEAVDECFSLIQCIQLMQQIVVFLEKRFLFFRQYIGQSCSLFICQPE